jgi:hypothetical protein
LFAFVRLPEKEDDKKFIIENDKNIELEYLKNYLKGIKLDESQNFSIYQF